MYTHELQNEIYDNHSHFLDAFFYKTKFTIIIHIFFIRRTYTHVTTKRIITGYQTCRKSDRKIGLLVYFWSCDFGTELYVK